MEKDGLKANLISYNAMIDACAKTGAVEKAEFWLRTMLSGGVEADVVSYSSTIDACSKAGMLELFRLV